MAQFLKKKILLMKSAPKLNHKTMYPSAVARQQVSLALNVIHELTTAAVRKETTQEYETSLFLDIVSKWWDIMNI